MAILYKVTDLANWKELMCFLEQVARRTRTSFM